MSLFICCFCFNNFLLTSCFYYEENLGNALKIHPFLNFYVLNGGGLWHFADFRVFGFYILGESPDSRVQDALRIPNFPINSAQACREGGAEGAVFPGP